MASVFGPEAQYPEASRAALSLTGLSCNWRGNERTAEQSTATHPHTAIVGSDLIRAARTSWDYVPKKQKNKAINAINAMNAINAVPAQSARTDEKKQQFQFSRWRALSIQIRKKGRKPPSGSNTTFPPPTDQCSLQLGAGGDPDGRQLGLDPGDGGGHLPELFFPGVEVCLDHERGQGAR